VVTNLLAAAGADNLGERIGLDSALGQRPLSGVLGGIVYALVLIPVLIAALNALNIEAVTAPASRMLGMVLGALPDIFAAAVVLLISFAVGRVLSGLVANVLSGIGFDRLPAAVGLVREGTSLARQPSRIAGTVVLVAVMLFAASEAASLLGMEIVSALVGQFIVFAGHVFFGLVIMTLGLVLANLAGNAVRATSASHAPLLATAARVAVLVFTAAMALRQMGMANEIITLAFGLLFGAVAVALAIAFGVGGREAAASQLQEWRLSLRKDEGDSKTMEESM
jgi:hypothetical protein